VIAALGLGAPVVAVPIVLIAGLVTPGYDPAQKTISRLAEPGLPTALAVGFAILIVGLALLGLAIILGPGAVMGRSLLAIAGVSAVLTHEDVPGHKTYGLEIPDLGPVILLTITLNVAAQLGDLVESLIKRGAGVKDSGAILPGHGGMFDRIDALLFAAPVLWFYTAWRVMQ